MMSDKDLLSDLMKGAEARVSRLDALCDTVTGRIDAASAKVDAMVSRITEDTKAERGHE